MPGFRFKFLKETVILLVSLLGVKLLLNSINITKYDYSNILPFQSGSDDISNLQLNKITINENSKNEKKVPSQMEDSKSSLERLVEREVVPLLPIENDLLYRPPIDLALIFTKAADNIVLQYHLRRAVTSILKNALAPIRLHLISDDESFSVGSAIIKEVQETNQWDARHMKLVFVSAIELANEVEPTVRMLQNYFTRKLHSKYRDFLFFFSLFLDRLLPGLTNIILMDIDILVKGDIAELYSYFSRFTDTQVMGICPELSPIYRHILSSYRSKYPNTTHGSTISNGGFPGYNSGVLLINIPRFKNSSIIRSYINPKMLDAKTSEYSFRGHLGDQDLFTLIALDHPEIFYTVPCNWNRQLCRWWNIKPYKDIFEEYFKCSGK